MLGTLVLGRTETARAAASWMQPEQPAEIGAWVPASGLGFMVSAGGGASNFTDSTTRDVTSVMGSWSASVVLGTRTFIGLEGDYVGAAGSVSALGIGGSTSKTLVRNGFQGLLRLQLPFVETNMLIEPYMFGGLGYDHYSFTGSLPSTASVTATDNTMTVPAGGGLMIGYRGFMFDARFTYRPTYFENLFSNTGLTNWNASGAIGYEF
jgi:hypothetical protein